MQTYLIIFFSPLLNQYLGFFKCRKDFPVKQLISELAVKGFNITYLRNEKSAKSATTS
jgi:hypothetical protein